MITDQSTESDLSEPVTKYASQPTKQPTQQPATFLWVGEKGNQAPKDISLSARQSFIRNRNLRIKRETQLRNLKASLKLPGRDHPQSSTQDHATCAQEHSRERSNKLLQNSLRCRNIQAGLIQAFPRLTHSTNEDPNFYYHYYRVYASNVSFPLCAGTMARWFFKEGLREPALIETILFLSSASRTANLRTNNASPLRIQKSVEDELQLRSQAFGSLQKLLKSSSEIVFSEMTILVIAHLLCIECTLAHVDAVNAHLSGMEKIINKLGGLENMGIRTLSTIYTCDVIKGMIQDDPPRFNICQRYESWIRENSICIGLHDNATPSPSLIGSHFFTSPWSTNLPTELRIILQIFQNIIPCHEKMIEEDKRQMPVENDCLIFMIHRLYSLRYNTQLTPFQDVICISVMIYAITRIWGIHGKPCMVFIAQNFRALLEYCHEELMSVAPDLLFWALILGGVVSINTEAHGWFLGRLKAWAQYNDVYKYEEAAAIWGKFFFVSRRRDEPARKLWRSVLEYGV